jgi:hypothetical protein
MLPSQLPGRWAFRMKANIPNIPTNFLRGGLKKTAHGAGVSGISIRASVSENPASDESQDSRSACVLAHCGTNQGECLCASAG